MTAVEAPTTAPTAAEAPRDPNRMGGVFTAGDPLRAIAALWIVSYHICANALNRTTVYSPGLDFGVSLGEVGSVISRARLSVWLFFGLSGYLLGRPFIHAVVTGRRLPRLKPFFRNRALRILPVFWLAVAATLLLRGRNGATWGEVLAVPSFSQMWWQSGFSNAIPQAWTLGPELYFYGSLPLLGFVAHRLLAGRLTPTLRALVILVGMIALSAASLVFRVINEEDFVAIYYHPPGVWFSFAAGMAVAAAEPLLRDLVRTPERGRIWATSIGLLGLAMVVVYIRYHGTSTIVFTTVSWLAVFCVLLAPLMLQWTTGRCWRFLDNRAMHWIGERSYSFYLWHVLIFVGLSKPIPEFDSAWLTVLALAVPALIVSLVAAHLSYRYIEVPFMARKHVWRRATGPGAT